MANEKYTIEMAKDEMLKFYANKIINESIVKCSKDNGCFVPTIFLKDKLIIENLEEIAKEIQKDRKVVKVSIDKNFNEIDISFYAKYCPRYYREDKSIENEEGYDFINRFVEFLKQIDYPGSATNSRDVIMKCIEYKCPKDKDMGAMYDVICIALNKSGFIDKYIEEYTVPINEKNLPELIETMEKTKEEIKKSIESGEIENG